MRSEPDSMQQDDGDEALEGHRPMTWEEYRLRYLLERGVWCQELREGGQNDRSSPSMPPTGAPFTRERPSPRGQPQLQEPQQQRQVRQLIPPLPALVDFLRRFHPNRDMLIESLRVFGRLLLATFLVYRSVTPYNVAMILGIYVVLLGIKFVLTSIRVEREEMDGPHGAAPAPAVVHNAAVPHHHHHHHRVSPVRKAVYIVTRCITSFLLSLSPTYSVEKLEAELVEDGIVVPHLHQD
ncbi:hypothetical protein DQ04_05001000 [Trypanosoma grayi]|uniref:hypothetical protein n=1 Tax=Trypanosoma grayi TaxID=71804 RepID=UPI0004F40B85|nr:hypothetical protein DQ04_05001000 [Trypanosoma grayi]KEG09575.1 hypothetical protein DQ04_05001000 [Trypanosoma grayi]